MRGQWVLILGLVAALIISVFAVINVNTVTVNYAFGTAEWPLIIVILTSVLLGGLVVGSVGIFRFFKLKQQLKKLKKENEQLKTDLSELETTQLEQIEEKTTEETEEQSENEGKNQS